jgi:phosphoribosyl-dephospho-CoA transferase
MQAVGYRPHDLLWVPADRLQLAGEWPQWADTEWMRCAPLVVRRETTGAGQVPVGLRGKARSQRSKGYLPRAAVQRCVTPEMLAAGLSNRSTCTSVFAVLSTLLVIAPALDASGLAWGPTGGVGFFLATGLPVLRPNSDLDLVVRAPQPLGWTQATALAEVQAQSACRIDIQIDTGHGAFALAEWGRAGGRVMLKTNDGPLLCTNPWELEATA